MKAVSFGFAGQGSAIMRGAMVSGVHQISQVYRFDMHGFRVSSGHGLYRHKVLHADKYAQQASRGGVLQLKGWMSACAA